MSLKYLEGKTLFKVTTQQAYVMLEWDDGTVTIIANTPDGVVFETELPSTEMVTIQ